MKPTDEQLWERMREGDRDALAGIATRFYRPLLHYGTRFTADQDLIKDNIQELLLILWQRRTELSQTPSVKLYLFKALRHRLFKEFKRSETLHHDWTEDELPPLNDEIPFVQAQQDAFDLDRLNSLLAKLTPRQREILYLRYYENLGYEEIAQLTGINRQSVANTLHRTLDKLRENWIVVVWWLGAGLATYIRALL